MFKNYFKPAWRNLFRNKTSSFINIIGLSVGMAVTMLIGLWIRDELSFNEYHSNYKRIASVIQLQTFNGQVEQAATPIALVAELRNNYGSDLKHVVISDWNDPHI